MHIDKSLILKIPVSLVSYADVVRYIKQSSKPQIIFAANVHMLMEAHDDANFGAVLARADILTPDGMPLVWLMRLKGVPGQTRVYGPTLMLHVLAMAEQAGLAVGFYGGSERTLQALQARLYRDYPKLQVAYAYSPPFRALSEQEDARVCAEIVESGARILFVGLGCPKQEFWMHAHRAQLPLVMLGVGAAFDFYAGIKPQAPLWLQRLGLEWLFRLLSEPKRLARRYLYHNPRFVFFALLDLFGMYRLNR
jgi:N-acetylglucosaminyldiphosphoundecaprenol N-acetyl-beta-D-mannosaminyltransferase